MWRLIQHWESVLSQEVLGYSADKSGKMDLVEVASREGPEWPILSEMLQECCQAFMSVLRAGSLAFGHKVLENHALGIKELTLAWSSSHLALTDPFVASKSPWAYWLRLRRVVEHPRPICSHNWFQKWFSLLEMGLFVILCKLQILSLMGGMVSIYLLALEAQIFMQSLENDWDW